MLLLLFTFPPAAWYMMGKEARYHRWFVILLWINTAAILAVTIPFLFFTLPKLTQLYQNFNSPQSSTLPSILSLAAIGVALFQGGYGLYLRRQIKAAGKISRSALWVTITLFILNYLTGLFVINLTVLSAVFPLYNLTDSFK